MVDYDSVKENLEARVKEAPTATENKSDVEKAMVQLHFERGAISAEEVAVFTAAAKLDFEGTKKLLLAKAGKNNASAFVAGLGGSNQSKGEGRENWTYYDYVQKDAEALSLIAKNDPDKFKRLEADFVNESKKMNIGSI